MIWKGRKKGSWKCSEQGPRNKEGWYSECHRQIDLCGHGWKDGLRPDSILFYIQWGSLKMLEQRNAATINAVIYQHEFDISVQPEKKGKETQGREILAVSQVWDGRAKTGIGHEKEKRKEWIMNFRMLKEESTGLNYFKDREREKPKMSFELWALSFRFSC